jgi:DNA-binding NarL/FixJ family response regulator
MIKVLLADDHRIVRAGLRRLIEESGDLTVVAEAADGLEAISQAREKEPDVAVIDLTMPGLDGLEVISRLKLYCPKLPILVLTMHEEEQFVVRSLEAGAKGYITKQSAPEQLVTAIRKVFTGGRYLTETAAEALTIHTARGAGGRSLLNALSNREIEVLRCLASGRTHREIAEAYSISIKTVDAYRQHLLKKLNLRNNADLTRFAIQHRLVQP